MNIYIRPDLEEHLRKEQSMSGLINKLLHEHYDKLGKNIQRPVTETVQFNKKKLDSLPPRAKISPEHLMAAVEPISKKFSGS